MSEWISVEDEHPPKTEVLQYFPPSKQGHSSNNLPAMMRIGFGRKAGNREASHWMRLPVPPETKGQSE